MSDQKIIGAPALVTQRTTDAYEVSNNGAGTFYETRAQQSSYFASIYFPSSSVNNNIVTFNGTTGSLVKDSGITLLAANIQDTGVVYTDGTSLVSDATNFSWNKSTHTLSVPNFIATISAILPNNNLNQLRVSPQGSDSTGNGSLNNPYLSVTHAESVTTTATASNLYALLVNGSTAEGLLVLKPFISLVGSSKNINTVSGAGVNLDASWASATNPSLTIKSLNLKSSAGNFILNPGSFKADASIFIDDASLDDLSASSISNIGQLSISNGSDFDILETNDIPLITISNSVCTGQFYIFTSDSTDVPTINDTITNSNIPFLFITNSGGTSTATVTVNISSSQIGFIQLSGFDTGGAVILNIDEESFPVGGYDAGGALSFTINTNLFSSSSNTVVGTSATNQNLSSNTSTQNVVVGVSSGIGLSLLGANKATIVGYNSGQLISTGLNLTAVGAFAAQFQTGDNNTAYGSSALLGVNGSSAGLNNSAFGFSALILSTGSRNTGVGSKAGLNQTSGNDNTLVGQNSAQTLTSGSQNTLIGSSANLGSATSTNRTVVGYNVSGATDNQVVLGNTSVTSVINQNTSGGCTLGTVGNPYGSLFLGTSGVGNNLNISPATQAAARTYTIPDAGQNSNFVLNTIIDVTGTSQAMLPGSAYIANNASLVTLSLPATFSKGSVFQIVGEGAGGWTITQNSGQSIKILSQTTTTGIGGTLSSTQQFNCVSLFALVANTTLIVTSAMGNLTPV